MNSERVYSRILGTGSYLPKKILTNAELEKMVDTTDEWIMTRTGIKQRHIVSEGENTTSMALAAAQQALQASGLQANDIGGIIVGTSSSENAFPSTACYLQKALGITNASMAFDVSAACSGFVYVLSIADLMIRNQQANNVLIIGVDAISCFTDWTDRSTCVLFGDGAGAMILGCSDEPGIYSTHLHAAGEHTDLLWAPRAGNAAGESVTIRMEGKAVFKFAVNKLGEMVEEALAANDMLPEHVTWLVPHQANIRIIQATAKKLNMPMEKVIVTVDQHANTSAASVPLALDTAIRDGRIQRGDNLLLEAFGGGLTWGSALVKY